MQQLINTREQDLSLLLDRHLVITANAGSGKTRTLVNRYLAIVDTGISPDEIVAITFTRKAANEMLAKIIQAVEDKIRRIGDNPIEMKRLMEIREKLSSAKIMTIHSFCSSLLRDYPAEANVNPFFVELNHAELYRIKQDNIVYVLEEMLKNELYKDDIKYLLLRLGIDKVIRFIEEILNRAEIFDELKQFYLQQEPEEYIDRVLEDFKRIIYEPLVCAIKRLNEINNYINSFGLTQKQSLAYREFSETLEKIVFLISEPFEREKCKELFNLLERLFKIKPSILTNQFKINKVFLNKFKIDAFLSKVTIEYIEESYRLFGIFKYIPDIIPVVADDSYELEIFKMNRILIQLSEKIFEEIEKEKQYIGGIDFNDMLIKADNILKDNKIADKVRKKIKYILIDEFQDTNDLQYRIIQKIVPSLNGKFYENEPVNLYVVGDAKQSIYAFRNADMRVFKKVINSISNINNLRLKMNAIKRQAYINSIRYELTESEAEGNIILSATFRLFPAIAAFVNKVCGYAFKLENTEFDVDYEDLVCTRCGEIIQSPKTELHNIGSVSLLIVEKKQKNEDEEEESDEIVEEKENKEAILLAKYLLKIVTGNEPFTIDDNGNRRRIKWGDICILARTKSFCNELSECFLKFNIPYVVHSGSGFFESAEIRDLIEFLKFIENPYNDVAFLGVLKSQFLRFDDNFLLKLKLSSDKLTFWEKFNELPLTDTFNELPPEEQERFKTAFSALQKAINHSNRIPISALIMIFLEDTHWYGFAKASPAFQQMVSNVNKFIELARNYEARGFRSLGDFVSELQSVENSNLIEAEAPFISDDDAVNIMTIHSAKGLEFPIVVLYKASAFKYQNPEIYISVENGIGYKVRIYENNLNKEITPLSCIFNKIRDKQATKAEEKRLLYVALTRAKEHLIITAINDEDGVYFWEYIRKSLVKELGEHIIERRNKTLWIDSELNFYLDGKKINSKIKYPLYLVFDVKDFEPFTEKLDKKLTEKPLLIGDLIARPINEFYSATKFHFFDTNINEFIEYYRLGLDKELEFSSEKYYESDNPDYSFIKGNVFGVIIHKLFEKVNEWFVDGLINLSIFNTTLDKIILEMNLLINENDRNSITEICSNVINSEFIRRNGEQLKNANFEYEIYLPIGTEILYGVIDVLFRDKTGKWEIWDWKSNKVDNFEDLNRLAEQYELQMRIYAFMVSKLFPEQTEFVARLLFIRAINKFSENEYWIKTFRFTKEELENFAEILISKTMEIKRALYFLE